VEQGGKGMRFISSRERKKEGKGHKEEGGKDVDSYSCLAVKKREGGNTLRINKGRRLNPISNQRRKTKQNPPTLFRKKKKSRKSTLFLKTLT